MHILLLSQWYPPEPTSLLQELAQTWQELGHEVVVLTGFPNYPSGQLYPGYRIRLWQKENLAGVPIVRVPLYPEHSRSGFRRALNYISFALSSSLLGPLLINRPDVIFVYHPPLTIGLPAWFLSRFWHIPFVYQIQDLWPETLRATGMIHSESIFSWVDRFARWVYRRAEAICVISPGFRKNLIDKGVPSEKIQVISNWVDTTICYPEEPDADLARELGLDKKFNVMFAGNMGVAQDLETVIRAANLLQELESVQFVFVGDGVALAGLQNIVREFKLENVKFLGRFPSEMMPSLYALADVLLVHLKDEPLFNITIPHKIFAYMASGKPVLAAIRGDAADIIRDVEAGVVCEPGQPDKLASAVIKLYNLSTIERQEMGLRGLHRVRTSYDRERLVKHIVAQLEAAVSSS